MKAKEPRWRFTYSVATTLPFTEVLFALLAGMRDHYTGTAVEFQKYRKLCAKEGFVFQDIKRRKL